MKLPIRIIGHKGFALLILVGIGLAMLVIPAFTGHLGINPIEKLLHRSGDIAIWILASVLCLSPLRVLFPHSPLVAALNRHRRMIGVSACVYGLIHLSAHLLYEGDWESIRESLSKPFILIGLSGLTILVVLAATSNSWSMRKLGKNWKRLQRLAYVAAALLIYHQWIAGKGHWRDARWVLLVIVTLQLLRVVKTRLARLQSPRASRP